MKSSSKQPLMNVRQRFSFTSISFRLILFIVASQALLYGVFAFLILDSSNEAIRASEESTFRLLENTVRWSIEGELESARLSIISIVEDRQAGEFFYNKDHDGLRQYLDPIYTKIRDRVVRFHFHLPDGTSLLRMHDPDSYGDAIARSRPMISAALTLRTMVSGIELGRDGLGLRVVTPMFKDDTFLGVVEFGMEFGEAFVRQLSQKHEGDYFIFLFQEAGLPLYVAGTRESERCPLAERSLDALVAGTPVWSLDCIKARAVGLYPFRDFSGKAIGFVKAELLQIPLAEALHGVRYRLFILGIVLVGILGMTVVFSISTLLKPLHNVVAQTRTISSRILAGDVGYTGDVSETAFDFRAIISAVNEIISALRERATILQAIVQGIPGVVYYVGSDYQVKWANERAREISVNLVGSDIRSAASGFFNNEIGILQTAFGTGEMQRIEACYRDNAKQALICWEHLAVPVCTAGSRADHVIRISSDVSARHQAEAGLRQLNEELEQRVIDEVSRRQEGERIAEQKSRLAAIGELATGMAHEITQPLNAISFTFENFRTRLEQGKLDATYLTAKSAAVASDIERIRRVIDHVRLFARSVPEDYSVTFQPDSCVENALSLIAVQLASCGIDIKLVSSGKNQGINGNPYKFEQVLLNLLTNARDSIEERLLGESASDAADPLPGLITITIKDDGPWVHLEIEDNGIGVNEAVRSRLFDPFFSTKVPGKGTGLGLAISFGIIRDLAGTIDFVPTPGGIGALVRVSVPAVNSGDTVGHDD